MNIQIDGKDAGITLDGEKTLGEMLAGINRYLEGAGFCIAALELNGALINGSALADVFETPVDSVHSLNVKTRTAAEMAADALIAVRDALAELAAGVALLPEQLHDFEESPPLCFLKEKETALYKIIFAGLEEGDYAALKEKLDSLIAERRRELADPALELRAMEETVNEICTRLTDFPLDLQTGKDARAAQTMEQCTFIMRKFFRLIMLAQFYGYSYTTILNSDTINEFNSVLKEFLAAYENSDSVLSGDLAEYEIAPRFKELYQRVVQMEPQ